MIEREEGCLKRKKLDKDRDRGGAVVCCVIEKEERGLKKKKFLYTYDLPENEIKIREFKT